MHPPIPTYFYAMHIVVNNIYLQGNHPHGNHFVQHLFGYLIDKHPEHHFYFLVDKSDNNNYPKADNATIIAINSSIKNIASLKIWDTIRLPKMLKQLKANILIQPNGLTAAPKLPQLMLVIDQLWMQKQSSVSAFLRWYHRVFMKQGIHKAAQIVTLAEQTRQDLLSNYPTASGKISLVYSAASSLFHPVEYDQKQQTKDGYADGREYFFYTGIHHSTKNILELLKAFTLFKRWQKSNMKLLVAGTIAAEKNGIIQKLSSYKYKDDVVLLPSITEQQLAQITAAAYAVIHPFFHEPLSMPILSSMQCGVPVITINANNIEEIGGDTCLYVSPYDSEALANEMKLLYRDELLSRLLVEKGLQQSAVFNWERTGELFWDAVLKAVAN